MDGHWIAGRWGAEPGVWRAPGDPGGAPAWPRAGAAELERALDALGGAAEAWARLPPATRSARLAAARAVLDDVPREPLARALGLDAGEPPPRALVEAPAATVPFGAGLGPDAAGPTLVVADWREGPAGLARRVLGRLAAGRPVVALAHPRLPAAGAAVAAALDACGPLPAAVLFDDGATLLRAAHAGARLGWSAFPTDERVRALADAGGGPDVAWEPMTRCTAVVRGGDDPADAARRVARGAFGRVETLSGQLSGAVGRVLCHELAFSAFGAALLELLEGAWRERPPVPLVEPATERRTHEVVGRALDEGACLVLGGERWQGARARVRALVPAVLTNVDPDRRVVRTPWPVPVLALARVRDDSEALERARGLDAGAPDVCDGAPFLDPGSPAR